ncbi:MAG TPA: CDP-diacylglycerol--serine O-phosphatidyltransferase [Dongiaceae bacterium]|nr:CDP-diacylglycerol--serine O-phosphatidyltransferase [Dongiaceae bacterium]
MSEKATPPAAAPPPEPRLKIYFLPNLLTAGNLFCGFVALTKIVEADPGGVTYFHQIKLALAFILLACIFDLFDGRVARMGGADSPFGREFDSLADLVSFGVAPAFLVHRVVLKDVFMVHPEAGWFIASIYLICGAFRLARFNCLAAQSGGGGGKEFLGFPIPSAAGLVASLTLFMIWWNEKDFAKSSLRYVLPVLLLFLSWMMVSEVKYPTFKTLDLRATKTFTKTLIAVLFIGSILVLREKILVFVLPAFFTSYLVYGFIRPRLSRAWRREIEEDDEEEEGHPHVHP